MKLKHLKPNQVIKIENKKEAKAIRRIAKKQGMSHYKNKLSEMSYPYGVDLEGNYLDWGELQGYIDRLFLPASQFLKPSNKKRIKILEMQVSELMDRNVTIPFNQHPIMIHTEMVNDELPEKWCVKHDRQEVTDYLNIHGENRPYCMPDDKNNYAHFPSFYEGCTTSNIIREGYTEITFEQFERLVLKADVSKMESTAEQLEVGKWYKHVFDHMSVIFCFNGKFGNETQYGFDAFSNYSNTIGIHEENIKSCIELSSEEIEAALVNEAKKRYPIGCTFVSVFSGQSDIFNSHDFTYYKSDNTLMYDEYGIFHNGKWAEIVSEPEIDWSVSGQLVCFYRLTGIDIIMTSGNHTEYNFTGMVVGGNQHKIGHLDDWSKSGFKPYTGKPIILE